MTRRTVDIEGRLADPPQTDNPARIHHLLDRLSAQDRIIGSLAPEQWHSIASRVPPGHREERKALTAIAKLAEQLRQED
jgi:hypothetical protein